jgi:hypothetical protein
VVHISLIYSSYAYVPEIEYLCKLFGSILKIKISSFHVSQFNPDDGISIGYCEVNSYPELPDSCKIRILPDKVFWREYLADRNPAVRLLDFQDIQVLNSNHPQLFLNKMNSCIYTNIDIFCSAFFIISGMEEINYTGEYDLHGRYTFTHGAWSKYYIDFPLIDIYAQTLFSWIEEAYGIAVKSQSNSFGAVISHDIDIPFYFGKIRTEISEILNSILSKGKYTSLSDILKYIGKLAHLYPDPFDTFDYIQKQEESRGIKSTYFILLSRDNAWGLNLKKYSRRLRSIADKKNEVALHPGYDSYCHSEMIIKERNLLESISGIEPVGVRNHFLRLKIPYSYQCCSQLNFEYDSTLGYPDREGFRTGTCSPYMPFDLSRRKIIDLIEIPLMIMDGTLRDYCRYNHDEALDRIKQCIDLVRSVNGTIVFNWHNSFLTHDNDSWRHVFESSLEYLVDNDAVFYTGKELSSISREHWM